MNVIPGPSTSSTRMELRTRFYYTYETLEWHKGRALHASGTGPSDVAWPEYTLLDWKTLDEGTSRDSPAGAAVR